MGATLTPGVWNRLLHMADLEKCAAFSKVIQVYNLTRNPPMETSLTICELYCVLLKWMLKITSFNFQVCLTLVERIIKNLLEVLLWNCGHCAPEYLFKVALCVYCCFKRCLSDLFTDNAPMS